MLTLILQAMHEFDSGRFFSAYELFLSAQLYNTAHTLALFELAPDAIIRRDLELLRSLFNPFDNDGKRDKVEGWFVRGKVRPVRRLHALFPSFLSRYIIRCSSTMSKL